MLHTIIDIAIIIVSVAAIVIIVRSRKGRK